MSLSRGLPNLKGPTESSVYVPTTPLNSFSSKKILESVNAAYSAHARDGVSAICMSVRVISRKMPDSMYTYLIFLDAQKVAEAFGYTEEELSSIPEGSHMGLCCGNPQAIAHIKEVIMSHSSSIHMKDFR